MVVQRPSAMAADAVDIQLASTCDRVPTAARLRRWVRAVLRAEQRDGSVAIRIMDEPEMRRLNARFRGKEGTTNVLSFPAEETGLLGDIAICAPVVAREAAEQRKSVDAHYAHLVVHGVLHLLGYDHDSAGEARIMENKEITILAEFGIDDPYVIEAAADD